MTRLPLRYDNIVECALSDFESHHPSRFHGHEGPVTGKWSSTVSWQGHKLSGGIYITTRISILYAPLGMQQSYHDSQTRQTM